MKKINCIIVDDELPAIEVLKHFCNQTPYLKLVGTFQDSTEALTYATLDTDLDLIFLDIEMPKLNGINFLKCLNGKCKVILATGYSKYALESYKYDILDYLVKPIAFEDFAKASLRIFKNDKVEYDFSADSDYFMAPTGARNVLKKVVFADIIYIEALHNYAKIVTETEEIKVYSTMKDIAEQLGDRFIRIHKSYIVATHQINLFENGYLILTNNQLKLPVGRTFKDSLSNFLTGKHLKSIARAS